MGNGTDNSQNGFDFYVYIARAFLKKHKVYRYQMKKTDDMSNAEVMSACHCFCEDKKLTDEFSSFRDREWNLMKVREYLGNTIKVTVDRPLGSRHPEYKDMIYPVNYGYLEGLCAPDGEWQDVYILGVYEAVNSFEGKVIAVIHRLNDREDKWVVAPDEYSFTEEEIIEATSFQEKYYDIEIIM